MARHAYFDSPARALLRAGLMVTAAGAVLGLGAAGAQAEPQAAGPVEGAAAALAGVDPDAAGHALTDTVPHVTDPVTSLRLDPPARAGVDALGTQVGGFQPLSTALAAGPVSEGAALKDLPVVGGVTGLVG
ncbi:hypothetical protein [Streptomyces purpureus]|uniref:ATP-binding protein n=1 Tax=Streptomyces purpureus TaxID=1951 RepID=A0A918HE30_9ACTN|nr:hypothetical protein [Streptomyces purpureus]GGT57533.1 hypothetical protein GCM10014713_58950 [Streptomyces purpureus]